MPRTHLGNPGVREATPSGLLAGPSPGDSYIGRIEEWVVSTVDERYKPAAEADWIHSLENFALAKRTTGSKEAAPGAPATPRGWARFRLSRRKGIAVASLTDQALVKDDDLFELTGDLLALIEAGYRRIVLDFSAVERLSSRAAAAIGEAVRMGFEGEGGSVKFSGVRPDLAVVFAMTGLDPRVACYPDAASAVAGLWPDQPEYRPLPVSILSALMRAEDARSRPAARARSLGVLTSRRRDDPAGCADEDPAAMNSTRLFVQDGPLMGRSFAIKGEKFVIGRGSDCQLRLESATVSRTHATIERRGGRLFLRDLASTNGTLLNGRPLRDPGSEIRDGDRIQIGKVAFALAVGPAVDRLDPLEEPGQGLAWHEEGNVSGFRGHPPDTTEESLDIDGLGEQVGLKFEVIEDVLVVTPLVSELADEASVDDFRDALLSLNGRRLPKRVVVNLAHVGYLSSRAIGVLVSHHLRLDRSGGALRLCFANPRVAVVLDQVKLGMLIAYHPTVEDAVISAWNSREGTPCRA